jgi:colicin import membrane protein
MAESRESSVLFSLKSLMDIESDRVHAEERARADRERREREALERRRGFEREAERQRIIAEEQRRAREQAMRDEAASRVATLKEAAITKARIEAESRARCELLQKEREHEARMAAIREVSRRRRDRAVLFGSNVALLAVLGLGLGLYFGKVNPDTAQRESELSRLVTAEGERADAAERLARQARRQAGDLTTELERTRSQLEDARAELEAHPPSVTVTPRPPTHPRGGGRPPDPAHEKCRFEGDPMCGNLP